MSRKSNEDKGKPIPPPSEEKEKPTPPPPPSEDSGETASHHLKEEENLRKKVQFLKDKLKECQEEKENAVNDMKIEIKNKEDTIEELRYRLRQEKSEEEDTAEEEEEEPRAERESDRPVDTEVVSDFQEKNRRLRQKNKNLQEKNKTLQEEIRGLKEEKKGLEKKVDELKDENKRLLKRLERYKEKGGEIGFNLPSNAEFRGDIKSEEMIQVGNNVKILGSLKSREDVILGHENDIKGDLISEEGNVKVGNATQVGGFIRGKEVRLAESVKGGEVQADEKVMIDKNCEVSDVLALGDVELGENVVVQGGLRYSGDFDASKGVKITESVLPSSKEELEREIDELLTEKPVFPPVVLGEGSEEEREEEISLKGELGKKIDSVSKLMNMCQEKGIDVAEEKYLLNEGAALYEEAKEMLSKCHTALDEKAPPQEKDEKTESKNETKPKDKTETDEDVPSQSQEEEIEDKKIKQETEETEKKVEKDEKTDEKTDEKEPPKEKDEKTEPKNETNPKDKTGMDEKAPPRETLKEEIKEGGSLASLVDEISAYEPEEREELQKKKEDEPVKEEEEGKLKCPQCGINVGSALEVCYSCGADLTEVGGEKEKKEDLEKRDIEEAEVKEEKEEEGEKKEKVAEKEVDEEDAKGAEEIDETGEKSPREATKEEIIDELKEIRGVGPSMAEKLYEGGFLSVEDIKEASLEDLQGVEGIGSAFSKKIKDNI